MTNIQIKHFKVLSLPTSPQPNSVYYVLNQTNGKVQTYITDMSGVPIPLVDLVGSGNGVSGNLQTTLESGPNSVFTGASASIMGGLTGSRFVDFKTDNRLSGIDFRESTFLLNPNVFSASVLKGSNKTSIFMSDETGVMLQRTNVNSGVNTSLLLPVSTSTVEFSTPINKIGSQTFAMLSDLGSGGSTNLTYTPSSINGIIVSDTGTDATIPLASNINAGLLSPSEKQLIVGAAQSSNLATVATTGSYTNLLNLPTSFPPSAHTHTISDIVNLQSSLDNKQPNLVSGNNIKTVNGNSLLGSGDLVITSATGINVFNVKTYGALGNGLTDDTLAIQNAILACDTAGGGIVYFPNGEYLINGALDSASNSQIYFPLNSINDSANLKTIKLLGETPPNQYSNPFVEAGGLGNEHPNKGVILKSNLTTAGNIIGSRTEVVSWGNFNFLHVNIENISVRISSRTGTTNIIPRATGINMGGLAFFDGQFIEVATTGRMHQVLEPATTCYGIIMPKNNNFAFCNLRNFNVYGVYIAVDCYEHTSLNDYLIDVCVIGLNFNFANHTIRVGKGCIARSRYNVQCQSNSKFYIDHLSVEDDYSKSIPTPTWNATLADVNDIDSTSIGILNLNIIRSNFGVDNAMFKISSTNSKVVVRDLRGVLLTKTSISFSNLLAYYRFESNSNDISGNLINGTPVNNPTYTVGRVGNALTLNSASGQYVNVGAVKLSNTGVFTIAGWFKINNTAAAFQTLFNKGDATLREYNCFYTKASNTITFANYNGTVTSGSVNTPGITLGTFVFIICEIIGNTIKISLNNNTPITNSCPVPSSATAKDLFIGSNEGNTAPLDGQIDEFIVLNRQLSPEEKGYLYNNGIGNSLLI